MTKVIAEITVSLDGFVTGPNADVDQGLGVGGEPLHRWVMESDDPVDADVLRESVENTGAVVMGRRLFEIVDGPHGWSDSMGYGAGHHVTPAFFVVTHSVPEHVRLKDDFTFVIDGLESAVRQARAAAGDKNVVVMGGGDVVRQTVDRGLADELRLHIAPMLLGSGTPLFIDVDRRELVQVEAKVSSTAVHVTYSLLQR
jgi:dihydrofolate reductase